MCVEGGLAGVDVHGTWTLHGTRTMRGPDGNPVTTDLTKSIVLSGSSCTLRAAGFDEAACGIDSTSASCDVDAPAAHTMRSLVVCADSEGVVRYRFSEIITRSMITMVFEQGTLTR